MDLDSLTQLARKLRRREETSLVGVERGLALVVLRWGVDNLEEVDAQFARAPLEVLDDCPESTLGPTDSRFLARVLRACARARPSDLTHLRYRIEGAAEGLRNIEEMRKTCKPESPESEAGNAAAEKSRATVRDLVGLTMSTTAEPANLADRQVILRLAEEALGSGDALVAEVRLVAAYETRLGFRP